jgi:hypothetical protein
MAGLINLEMTKRIVMDSFYSEIAAAQNERLYPLISENIPQEVTSVTRPGFGSVPKPTQISGTTAGTNAAQARSIKDYQFTTTVVEWDLTIDFPRSTVEDLPDEAAAKARDLANSGAVFFDERAVQQLDGSTVGYDGKALYSTTHDESGSNQDNTATGTVATPAASDIEARIGAAIVKLRNFRDDQNRPVNEGTTRYLLLVGPDLERVANIALNPTMSQQAVDSSGVTGVYRGQFDIRTSAYVPTKKMYLFATNRLRKALGFYTKTAWSFTNNIGTASDEWNFGRTALFSGYARFELLPRDWKVTVRCDFN